MPGEKINFEQARAQAGASGATPASGSSAPGEPKKHEQSTIVFPNYDLPAAVTVAKAMYSRAGLAACPLDELAAELKTTMSGNFRNKNSAARIFGFVEKDGSSAFKLTELGCRLLSQESEADAKASAFLLVPLYREIFEAYRGKLLPPTKALEREMTMRGVIPTQATNARQIFQRSAREAGYFNSGEDRLVRPKSSASNQEPQPVEQAFADSPVGERPKNSQFRFGGGSGGDGTGFHPFVQGLLQTLPEPNTVWTIEGRAAWLEAAANIFKLIYQGDGRITVTAEIEKPNNSGSSH